MELYFYDVDADYIDYLKAWEKGHRGFTRVPDVVYENSRKMVCGIVLEVNGFKYYVPISSYKRQQSNNILIRLDDDHYNPIKASCDFKLLERGAEKYGQATTES